MVQSAMIFDSAYHGTIGTVYESAQHLRIGRLEGHESIELCKAIDLFVHVGALRETTNHEDILANISQGCAKQ
jgi:hypothetical protein